jgi:hypothetical protein
LAVAAAKQPVARNAVVAKKAQKLAVKPGKPSAKPVGKAAAKRAASR